MTRFKPNNKKKFEINTSSLPDIVFMLLFFFMVVTNIKPDEQLMEIEKPQTEEYHTIKNRSLVDHIHIGIIDQIEILQLNDAISDISQVSNWVNACTDSRIKSEQNKIIRSLHIDKSVKMKLVQEVKLELRKSNALKILYATIPQSK